MKHEKESGIIDNLMGKGCDFDGVKDFKQLDFINNNCKGISKKINQRIVNGCRSRFIHKKLFPCSL